MIFSVLCVGCNTFGSDQSVSDLSEVKGIYIYSDWSGDLSASVDEPIHIQLPVYDFSNELETARINVSGFDFGKIENTSLVKTQVFPDFDQYLLSFDLVPQKVGKFEVKNLNLWLETKSKKQYKEKFGDSILDVRSKQNMPFKIKTASGMTATPDMNVPLHYSSNLMNTSASNIELVSLEYNSKAILSENGPIQLNRVLQPGKSYTIDKNFNIRNPHGNFYFKPRLVCRLNGHTVTYPLNLTVLAYTMPLKELEKRLKQKGMLHE